MKAKKYIHVLLAILISVAVQAQNIGINSTGATPRDCAMLDILSSTTGLLIPNLALTSITTYAPATGTAVDGLIIYNTATAGSTPNNVYPGYYYWSTTGSKWVALAGNGSKNWSLTGNAGTTVGTNFLGTTDDVDLQFNVNNVRSGLIDHANQQTFLGYNAGVATTAAGNLTTFIGHSSGVTNTSGNANTAVGYGSLKNNNTANDNTAIGVDALYYMNTDGNTGVGSHALEGSSTVASNTGNYNTAIGYAAGSGYSGTPNNLPFTTGSYNTFLGFNTTITPGTLSNVTAIGANAQVTQANSIVLGGISGVNTATVNTNVGIGTTAPAQSLDIFGKFQVNSSGDAVKIKNVPYSWPSSQGAVNTYLRNDGSGNLSWSTPYGANVYSVSRTAAGAYTVTPTSTSTTAVTAAANDIKTRSTAFSDMEGMTITFTPVHSVVFLHFTAAGATDLGTINYTQWVECKATNSAATTTYGGCVSNAQAQDYTSGSSTGAWNCNMMIPVVVTPGTSTTIKIQWTTGGNAGTLSYAQCYPFGFSSYSHRTMVIWD